MALGTTGLPPPGTPSLRPCGLWGTALSVNNSNKHRALGLRASRGRTCVARQLPADPDVALAGLQAVDGADVVQAAAGHKVTGRGVGAGHHPGGTQGDGVHLTRGKGHGEALFTWWPAAILAPTECGTPHPV